MAICAGSQSVRNIHLNAVIQQTLQGNCAARRWVLVVAEMRMMISCSGHWKGIFSFGAVIIFILLFPHFCVLKTHFKMQLFYIKGQREVFAGMLVSFSLLHLNIKDKPIIYRG